MRHFLITCILLLSCSMGTWAQNIVVTGVVTDAQKEPLIGVNVAVKDVPGLGAITDINGKYKISIEPYQRLIFSYVGFDKVEVLIKEQRVVNVSMKESAASSLDEVVITGTGVQKKLTVTGAITTVNVSDLTHTANGNVVNALAGNVAGVLAMQTSGQPGRNTSEFWIRGISTFGASTSALVLVDGFERDLDDVNIEDIESFSVLKDASATAIYGSRGANGVVLITTKHGKAGKINIDAKVETSYNTRTITPKFVDGYTYATMMNEARITRNQEPIYQQDELDLLRMGLDPDLYPNVDWTDLLLKDGAMTYRANVNMNGGGSTARYFVSLSYLKEDGMYKTDETLRKDYNTNANANTWNYRLNTDIDITKTTLLKVGVSGSLKKYNEPGLSGDVWKSLMYQNPISVPVMYSNGYVPAYGTGDRTNPWVLATQTGYKEHWENTIQSNLTLEQKLDFITQGLKFVGRFGFDTWNKNNIDRIKWPEQYKAQRFRDENGNLVFDRVTEEQKMKQTSSAEGNRNEIFEAELHYDRGFKEHHVGGLLKFNQDSKVFTVGTGEDIKKGIARRHLGLAGRVSYNWNYRYFVDFNFGYNGSENFAKNNRFGFFPSIALGYNISQEKFWEPISNVISHFKLRGSYGLVGNDGINERYAYLEDIVLSSDKWKYTTGVNQNVNLQGPVWNRYYNPNLTWEVGKKLNVGFDMQLFHQVNLNFDVFKEIRSKIYMQKVNTLPDFIGTGETKIYENSGKMKNVGFDIALDYNKQITKDFFLSFKGTLTYAHNTILERDEPPFQLYPNLSSVGYSRGQHLVYVADGLFRDQADVDSHAEQTLGYIPQPGDIKYVDQPDANGNCDGIINTNDRVYMGYPEDPEIVYGFGPSMKYKNWDFSFFFQGAARTSILMSGFHPFGKNAARGVMKFIADDYWSESNPNPNAAYPRLTRDTNANNTVNSSYWLRNGAFLKLKNAEIGYTFKMFRAYLNGSNLLTFSPFKHWDPEMGGGSGMKYPTQRVFNIGIQFTFK